MHSAAAQSVERRRSIEMQRYISSALILLLFILDVQRAGSAGTHSGAPVNFQLSFHKVGFHHSWCVLQTTSVQWPSTNTGRIHISLNLVKDLVLMRLCSVRREGKKLKLGCGAEARGRCWQQCCVDIQPGSLMQQCNEARVNNLRNYLLGSNQTFTIENVLCRFY